MVTATLASTTVSIHHAIEEQVRHVPGAIAVEFEGNCLTYQGLNERANQLAHYLQSLGVQPDTLVGICVERSLDMVVALLAILKAGGAYVPLDPTYPLERLTAIVDDANPSLLITQTHLTDYLPGHQAVPVYLDRWEWIAHQPSTNPVNSVQPHHLAYVIYTSGSTGRPKGVAIEHRNTLALIRWAKAFFSPQQLSGVLASTSLCFDLSVFELFVTLSRGGTIILAENALQLPKLNPQTPITLVNTVPSAIKAVWQQNGIPTSVRTINLAGEPLQNALVQNLYELDHVDQVFNLYGPSEDTTYSTAALVPKGATGVPSIGRPIVGTQIYLLDADLQPVPVGTEGELYISGDGVARGYLNQHQLTANRFVSNLFSADPQSRLYRTGDLAIYNSDGSLKFLGRIDHQVKVRGFRIELGDIESALNQHPTISESVVIAKEDAHRQQRLVAYVVPKKEEEAAAEHLEETGPSLDHQVQQWRQVWNSTYGQTPEEEQPSVPQATVPEDTPIAEDPNDEYNSIGWNDSFTGRPMLGHEVREWVDCTVDRILALRPQRVLEIGCGMGMLLFRIAPHCQHYFGIDLSAEAIHNVEQKLSDDPERWSHVSVAARAAHEVEDFEPGSFDTIVINSVIQYFPGIDYLVQVLERVAKLVKPGGRIFVGDVRSVPLLEAFHTGIQLCQSPDEMTCEQFKQRSRERMAHDKELVLHPDFFPALKHHLPEISHVQTQLKHGYTPNELIRFRSDVLLHIQDTIEVLAEPPCLDWQDEQPSALELFEYLQTNNIDTLRMTNILDARIATEIKAVELSAQVSDRQTVGSLRHQIHQQAKNCGIHPESFWQLSQTHPYDVFITWAKSKQAGIYDVVLKRRTADAEYQLLPDFIVEEPVQALKPWQDYANDPHQFNEAINVVPQLRSHLADKLPNYMMPSAFVVMESLPLTLNGKIDRRSLPDPKQERPLLNQAYVAPTTPTEQQLADIWSELLSIEQVGIEDSFFELGGHSLLAAQLLQQIEAKLQIELPLFYLLNKPTITGLIQSMDKLQTITTEKPGPQAIEIDWNAEISLDASIYPKAPQMPHYYGECQPKHVFLTGATGFLGAFLLDELMRQTQATVYCLVRARDMDDAQRRLEENLQTYGIWNPDYRSRIVSLPGDLSQPLLGLDETRFSELAISLDVIYHCGAFVNLVYPYTALKAANVGGTKEILKLACQEQAIPVHYISTIDVLKPLISAKRNVVQEHEHFESAKDLHMGYTQTKWVAEKLMMVAQSRGLPVTIYRPGMLTGHSQSGVVQTNDLMCRIIKGIVQLEAAPQLAHYVNMTPIDFASQSIIYSSLQPESWGKAFHVINPQPLPWQTLISELRQFGFSLETMSHHSWQTKLRYSAQSQTHDNVLAPMLSLFTEAGKDQITYLESFLSTAQAFDCQNMLDSLDGTSITCPIVDRRLLQIYFSYFVQSQFMDLPLLDPRLGSFVEEPYTAKITAA